MTEDFTEEKHLFNHALSQQSLVTAAVAASASASAASSPAP